MSATTSDTATSARLAVHHQHADHQEPHRARPDGGAAADGDGRPSEQTIAFLVRRARGERA